MSRLTGKRQAFSSEERPGEKKKKKSFRGPHAGLKARAFKGLGRKNQFDGSTQGRDTRAPSFVGTQDGQLGALDGPLEVGQVGRHIGPYVKN
jgi:hypothetical protein